MIPKGKVCRKPNPFQLKNLPGNDSPKRTEISETSLGTMSSKAIEKQKYCPINQKETLEIESLLMPSGVVTVFHLITDHKIMQWLTKKPTLCLILGAVGRCSEEKLMAFPGNLGKIHKAK